MGFEWYFQYFSLFGIGIHVLIAVFFAIHAMRNNQPFFWLWILFIFPFLGSVVYFIGVYLPRSRMPYQANAMGKKAMHILQPNRELNKAKEKYENIPSVDNAVRYAEYLISMDQPDQAIVILKQKYNALVENDCVFLEQLATAYLQDFKVEQSLEFTSKIRTLDPKYNVERIALLRALSFHQLKQEDEAKQEFLTATRSQDIEYLAEYVLWAIQTNQADLAQQIRADMQKKWAIGTKYSRQLQKPIFKQVDKALKEMGKKAA